MGKFTSELPRIQIYEYIAVTRFALFSAVREFFVGRSSTGIYGILSHTLQHVHPNKLTAFTLFLAMDWRKLRHATRLDTC